jgi:2-octaprenyl-6-methoxyphenol hydroxylase
MPAPGDACDVVIAGGGPVGATLALSLRASGLDVVLAEPQARPSNAFRPIALSHGSRLILERLGVFGLLGATPIETIHVSQAGGFGRTLMRREEHDLPALGYVTDGNELATVLGSTVAPQRLLGRVASWRAESDEIQIKLETDGAASEIRARLLVFADGGHVAGEDLVLQGYGQTAVVARVRTEISHRGVAFERFTARGPIALLPFAGASHALVWSVHNDEARNLLAASDERFIAALSAGFGRRLGTFAEVGTRESFPLKLAFRRSSVAGPRAIAVGNAAQTLHPVAGQGLNLGLRDAVELAELIRRTARDDLGGKEFLAEFRALRRYDRFAAIGVTDSLVRVFSNDYTWLRIARGMGLVGFDLFPPARRLLARRMMLGLRGFP